MKGFAPTPKPKLKYRTFLLELKQRFLSDQSERFIEYRPFQIVRLGDAQAEEKEVFAIVWSFLESDYCKERKCNQIFVFTADGNRIIHRIESHPFKDEPCKEWQPEVHQLLRKNG